MNNSNICPIIYSSKASLKNEISNSLEYYEKETKEHIIKHLAAGIYYSKKNVKKSKKVDNKIKKLIQYILSNDDMFSDMITSIMLADCTHDKNSSSLKYWRTKNCLWTLNKSAYKNKIRPLPLADAHMKPENSSYSKLEPTTFETPLDEILKKEEYTFLDQKIDSLEKREKEIIQLYYLDNMNEAQIAKRYSISQQRVSSILINIRKRLKNESTTK